MSRPRKYQLNEDYFTEISSNNQAYILGFIYADGSINLKRGSLDICISKNDNYILEFIKTELGYSGEIKSKKVNNIEYSLLNIVSKKLITRLNELGIIPNKTYNSKILPIVPNKLINHMLRGLFDGDGSIYKSGDKGYTVSFSSNIYILEIIKKYLESQSIKSSKIRLRNKNSIYSGMLEIRGNNQISKLYNLLYHNLTDFGLKRKLDRFIDFNNYLNNLSKRNISEDIITKIKELYLSNMKSKEIHLLLNVPYPSVRTVIKRLKDKKEIK